MRLRSWANGVALLAAIMLAGCGSPQERAQKSVTRFEQFYAAHDFYDARIEIQKAIAAKDDVAEYWNRLGRAQLGMRDYYQAYTAYQRAFELDANNAEALQAMAELAYSGGKPEEAVSLADKMLAKEPRNLRMLLVKAAAAVDDRNFPEARQLIAQMLSIDPENEGGTVLLGRVLFITGEGERGASLIEGSVRRTGSTMLKLNALSDIYTAAYDVDGIVRTYRRMFALDRTSVGLRLDYAKALYENNQPGHALSVIAQLQRARPHDIELKRQIVELWSMVGSDAIDLDQVRRFAEAGNDEMKLALANLAIEQNRFADALTVIKPFITGDKIDADNVVPQMLYAQALAGTGHRAEAIAIAGKVLAFDNTNPEALLLRVQVAIDRKAYAAALSDAQILGRDNPASAPARLALPRVYVARGDRIMADTSFARALGDLDDSEDVLRAYTTWLIDTDRAKMALDVATRFTERNRRSLRGWENRAELCLRLKDRDCMQDSADALELIHGGQKMHSILTAAMNAPRAKQ